MADDKMIFPIGFDLEKGVEEASKDWDKYAKKLEAALAKRAVKVKIGFDLDKKLDTLDDVKKKLSELKIEPITPENKAALRELIRELKELARIMEKVSSLKGIELPELQAAKAAKMRKEVEQADEKLRLAQERVRQAQERLTLSQKRAEQQAYKTSQAYHDQDGYVSRLLKRMAVYAAYSGVNTFLTSVREVTAQFELQRISLGAIIQDQQRANALFSEIKAFALTSPLKILDLTKYTKQVAAYGFEADKLFQTTKMLADISVGLGADMSRATLFLGQVYATGYLRAAELRQATELGIPLVDKLAKKLEELNGRVYSAADVMDLISNRAISFEMVESVFQDMTSAGGEFYNMQVKQSQTLFGMWSKLGDAAAIMYDQIGNTQGVNEGMKTLIQILEALMRNWKTTARWIDVVAGSIAMYAFLQKNATIASKALSAAESLALLTTKARAIETPKLVAALIGQNAATKVSTVLTTAHAAAMMREATATNILTKGFWKLTAAMFSNPWIAAAAAITAVGLALFHFIGNSETAAERMEALNNSVASLKNLDDTITPMIDTYNELINKTERTTEEEKKLSDVTHELAKRYPGAITAVGNFGDEVELASEKLNKLYEAEKKARMDNTRSKLSATEKQIKETEAEIERLQKYLSEGKMWGGGQSGIMVTMDDKEKSRVLKQIEELRFGTDGQSGLFGLQQSATEARRALGLIPSETAQAIEKFGAWKKTLTTFRQQVGDVRVQLFDDSTINQFGSLEEALKKTAEEYKKNIALVATYDDTLKSTVITAEERAKIETERAEADAMATLAKNALEYYNALSLLEEKGRGSGRTSDPRLQTLQEIANKMAEVNREYDELLKKEGQTKALADTQKLFASSFEQMQRVAKKYKFRLPTFEVPQTIEDVQKWYEAIADEIRRLGIKNADKVLIELGFKSDKLAIDKQQKTIEENLKRLSERISRTKTAKDFYEKILGQTGDVELAANITFNIYGENGEGLEKQMADQVRQIIGDTVVTLPDNIIGLDDKIDYKALRKFAKENEKELGGMYAKLVKIADDGENGLAKIAEQGAKLLLNYDEIAQQRVNIEQEASEKIKKLREAERMFLASNATLEQKKAYSKRTNKAVSGVESDRDLKLLRLKDEYLRFFSAIHSLTQKEAEKLRGEVRQALFKAFQGGAISADELKRELKAIDEQFNKLTKDSGKFVSYLEGGFDGLIKRLRDMSDEMMSVGSEIGKMDSVDQISVGQKSFINTMLKQFGNKTTGNSFASLLSKTNGDLSQMGSLLQGVSGEMGAMAEGGASALAMVDRIIKDVAATIEGIAAIRDQLNEMRSADNQLEGGFWDAFEYLENFNKYAYQGWENLKSGNVVGAVQNTVQSIISIFGTAQAQRVRKANKEIERQAELLEQLEYAYGRLQTAADKAFGREYLRNIEQQRKLLQAQAAAYQAQAEAEMSKGKSADEERLKEYRDAYRETLDELAEMQQAVSTRMLGTDLTSAARSFAEAWLAAYKEFGNTADAMSEKFREMIENMVVESMLAKVMEQALAPAFKMIDEMGDGDFYSEDFWREFAAEAKKGVANADAGAQLAMNFLGQAGMEMRELGGDLQGISRDIATASEESINGLAGHMNTVEYYVSRIDSNVALMVSGRSGKVVDGADEADLLGLQNQALGHLQAINQHTAETVAECRRIAVACEAQVVQLKRVITTPGGTSTGGVTVYMRR